MGAGCEGTAPSVCEACTGGACTIREVASAQGEACATVNSTSALSGQPCSQSDRRRRSFRFVEIGECDLGVGRDEPTCTVFGRGIEGGPCKDDSASSPGEDQGRPRFTELDRFRPIRLRPISSSANSTSTFSTFSTSANFWMLNFWTTKGGPWGPKGGGPKGGPKFRAVFPLSRHSFHSSFFLGYVEFWWCLKRRGPEKCSFGVLGLSCASPGGLVSGVSHDTGSLQGRGVQQRSHPPTDHQDMQWWVSDRNCDLRNALESMPLSPRWGLFFPMAQHSSLQGLGTFQWMGHQIALMASLIEESDAKRGGAS